MSPVETAVRNAVDSLPTESLRSFLACHDAAIAAGVNLGQIQRDRAEYARKVLAARDAK
jgi:hypothetical protein